MAIQPIEQDIRERAIAWANNSLYGSLRYCVANAPSLRLLNF